MQNTNDGINRCCELAFNIATDRKIKDLKARGRKVTERALMQWRHSPRCKEDIARIMLPILKEAKEITSTTHGEYFNKWVWLLLLDSLPVRGRPKKPRGIIVTAMRSKKKPPGRPSVLSIEKEEKWADYVFIIKCVLLGDLYRIRDFEVICTRIADDPLFEMAIKDAAAVRESERRLCEKQNRVFDTKRLPALKARYLRAKKNLRNSLNPAKKK